MQITKVRYYTENNKPRMERITFILGGTAGVSETDRRLRTVPGATGMWLFAHGMNLACQLPPLPTSAQISYGYNPATGKYGMVSRPVADPTQEGYYTSSYWEPLSLPLRPGVSLITESVYNTLVA